MASSIFITPGGVNNNGGALTFPLGTQLSELQLGVISMISSGAVNELRIPNGSGVEYLTCSWVSNSGYIGTVKNGGSARNCAFAAGGQVLLSPNNGINAWSLDVSGNLLAATDNTPNLGASAANRPATITAGTRVVAPAYTVGASAGASGTGTAISAITVTNGIVTAITVT